MLLALLYALLRLLIDPCVVNPDTKTCSPKCRQRLARDAKRDTPGSLSAESLAAEAVSHRGSAELGPTARSHTYRGVLDSDEAVTLLGIAELAAGVCGLTSVDDREFVKRLRDRFKGGARR